MTTLTLIAALIGVIIPPVVIVQALRSSAKDRWPEGLLGRRLSGDARHDQRHRPDRLFQLTLGNQNGLIRRSR